MGRVARICHPGLVYHVINRGNNRQAIFLEDEDYYHCLNILVRYKEKFDFKIFGYCLMTNHMHLLIKVGGIGNISKIMQAITLAHTRQYNYKYKQSGHVWQGRFQSPVISDDGYLLKVMQYVEQNPIRAGLVTGMGKYKWSSFGLQCRLKESKLLDREDNPVFQKLGETLALRIAQYKKLMRSSLAENEVEVMRRSFQTEGYMSERFKEQMHRIVSQKRKRGRPRKNLSISC